MTSGTIAAEWERFSPPSELELLFPAALRKRPLIAGGFTWCVVGDEVEVSAGCWGGLWMVGVGGGELDMGDGARREIVLEWSAVDGRVAVFGVCWFAASLCVNADCGRVAGSSVPALLGRVSFVLNSFVMLGTLALEALELDEDDGDIASKVVSRGCSSAVTGVVTFDSDSALVGGNGGGGRSAVAD